MRRVQTFSARSQKRPGLRGFTYLGEYAGKVVECRGQVLLEFGIARLSGHEPLADGDGLEVKLSSPVKIFREFPHVCKLAIA